MTGRYAFDAVVPSNFALADALDVLQHGYAGRGVVPAEVWDETAAGVARGLNALQRVDDLIATKAFSIVSLAAPERARYRELRKSLGSGEAACIAWSQGRGATVVTDDRQARVACRAVSLPFTGTVGILVASVRDGALTIARGEELLRQMRNDGFYSPVARLADLLT